MAEVSGPFGGWAETLRHVASELEHYQLPEPGPIPIVWTDFSFAHYTRGDVAETRAKLLKQYFAAMTKAGITDKEAQLELIEDILGAYSQRRVPITSRKDLTISELGRIIQALSDWEKIEGYSA